MSKTLIRTIDLNTYLLNLPFDILVYVLSFLNINTLDDVISTTNYSHTHLLDYIKPRLISIFNTNIRLSILKAKFKRRELLKQFTSKLKPTDIPVLSKNTKALAGLLELCIHPDSSIYLCSERFYLYSDIVYNPNNKPHKQYAFGHKYFSSNTVCKIYTVIIGYALKFYSNIYKYIDEMLFQIIQRKGRLYKLYIYSSEYRVPRNTLIRNYEEQILHLYSYIHYIINR